MDYRVTFKRPWSYRHPSKGWQTVQPGVYSVPEQFPLVCARLAVEQGMATLFEMQRPTVPVAASSKGDAENPPLQSLPALRRKGRAPKNKSLGRAPEDKSTLV